MSLPIRIGTRRSRLALTQTGHVRMALARALKVADADLDTALPLVEIVTTGDRIQDRRLLEVGGKALFTKEIEQALFDGHVDLAVHSMKDVPAEQPEGLVIGAIPEREDPRDAFVSEKFERFEDLPHGAILGTASLRRQAQVLALRPDIRIEMLRGNVDTRLRRLAEGDFDAILLAASGLNRLGFGHHVREGLSLEHFLPAPGQGALALQVREGDQNAPWLQALNHGPTALAVSAERGAMTALEGSCRTAIGAHAVLSGGAMTLTVEMLAPNGEHRWREAGTLDSPDLETARDVGLRIGQAVRDAAGGLVEVG